MTNSLQTLELVKTKSTATSKNNSIVRDDANAKTNKDKPKQNFLNKEKIYNVSTSNDH